jgi:hypothetical protein
MITATSPPAPKGRIAQGIPADSLPNRGTLLFRNNKVPFIGPHLVQHLPRSGCKARTARLMAVRLPTVDTPTCRVCPYSSACFRRSGGLAFGTIP